MTSIHGDLYDTGKPSLSDIAPTHHDHLKVCNTTYHCVKDSKGKLKWTTVPPVREEDRDNGCKVDSLHALAKVFGCVDSLKHANQKCRLSDEPCLTNGNGEYTCILKSSKSLPNTFMADMSCTDFRFDDENHRISRYQSFGENGADTAIVVASEKVSQERRVPDGDVKTGESVGLSENDMNNSVVRRVSHARCEWRSSNKSVPVTCNTNSDCRATNDEVFSAWWSVAHKDIDGAKFPTLRKFLDFEVRDSANAEIHYDASHAKVTDPTIPTTKIEMKRRLKELYDDDEGFRTSLRNVLNEEERYKHVREAIGTCTNGTCSGPKVKMSHTIFDKTRDIPLSLMEDDAGNVKIMYPGLDGMMHALRSQSCELDDAPQACSSESVPNVQDLVLRADSQPISSVYKVVLPDESVHLVSNAVTVPRGSGGDDETRRSCAIELCKRNSDRCPSSHCRLSGKLCVPTDESVSSIQIHDPIV